MKIEEKFKLARAHMSVAHYLFNQGTRYQTRSRPPFSQLPPNHHATAW
jgi:hypothetical protein